MCSAFSHSVPVIGSVISGAVVIGGEIWTLVLKVRMLLYFFVFLYGVVEEIANLCYFGITRTYELLPFGTLASWNCRHDKQDSRVPVL